MENITMACGCCWLSSSPLQDFSLSARFLWKWGASAAQLFCGERSGTWQSKEERLTLSLFCKLGGEILLFYYCSVTGKDFVLSREKMGLLSWGEEYLHRHADKGAVFPYYSWTRHISEWSYMLGMRKHCCRAVGCRHWLHGEQQGWGTSAVCGICGALGASLGLTYCSWQGGGRAKELHLGAMLSRVCNTSSTDVFKILSVPNHSALQHTSTAIPSAGRSSAAEPRASRRRRAQSAPWWRTPRSHPRGPCGSGPLCAAETGSAPMRLAGAEGKRWLCRPWGVKKGGLSGTVRAAPCSSTPGSEAAAVFCIAENSSWKGWVLFFLRRFWGKQSVCFHSCTSGFLFQFFSNHRSTIRESCGILWARLCVAFCF